MQKKTGIELLADYVFLSKYSQRLPDGNLETWEQTVDRIYAMHGVKLESLGLYDEEVQHRLFHAAQMEKQKKMLSSQRGRQFASPNWNSGILKHEAKMYNCCSTYIDRIEVFSEIMYLLLCGCGVGYSLHRPCIEKLPPVAVRSGKKEKFTIPDSIEGWADSIDVLMTNLFYGTDIEMGYALIRPQGALIDGKFSAPGAEPLMKAHENIRRVMLGAQGRKLTTIEVHDIICFIAESVVSGGVRRSAMIALFDKDDELMLKAKTGNWWNKNPQRAMANNSILTSREDRITYNEMKEKLQVIRQFGEPGVVNVENYDYTVNPCFTGDTLIFLADRKDPVKIKELADNKEPFAVLYRKGNTVAITQGIAFCTGTRQTVKVILSDGTSFRCTPEHKLMLRGGGEYVEAKDSLGCELEKFYCFQQPSGEEIGEQTEEDWKQEVTVMDVQEDIFEDVYDITVSAEEHNFAITTRYEVNGETVLQSGIYVHNCGEIVMKPKYAEYSGFAFCNLVEINAERIRSESDFYNLCETASFIATVQALYTDFKYLSRESKMIAERDRAIGVSITGIYASPILKNEVLKNGARIVAETNARYAAKFGIERSRTCTTIKPSGNASSILGLYCSGIHPAHADKYLRRVRIKTNSPEYKALKDTPMVKVLRGDEAVISFPISVDNPDVVCKDNVTAVEHLKFIGMVKHYWINKGGLEKKVVSNNISATVEVRDDEWDEVAAALFLNDHLFTGVSLLPKLGDQIYDNAPFQRLSSQEVQKEYDDIVKYLETHDVDFNAIMSGRSEIDSGELAAIGCAGGMCELKL